VSVVSNLQSQNKEKQSVIYHECHNNTIYIYCKLHTYMYIIYLTELCCLMLCCFNVLCCAPRGGGLLRLILAF